MYTLLGPCIYAKNAIFTCENSHFLHLYGQNRQFSVDQKVNTCWPKFHILQRGVLALRNYFYSRPNPFLGSGILNLLKKVSKIAIFALHIGLRIHRGWSLAFYQIDVLEYQFNLWIVLSLFLYKAFYYSPNTHFSLSISLFKSLHENNLFTIWVNPMSIDWIFTWET